MAFAPLRRANGAEEEGAEGTRPENTAGAGLGAEAGTGAAIEVAIAVSEEAARAAWVAEAISPDAVRHIRCVACVEAKGGPSCPAVAEGGAANRGGEYIGCGCGCRVA